MFIFHIDRFLLLACTLQYITIINDLKFTLFMINIELSKYGTVGRAASIIAFIVINLYYIID